VRGSAYEPDRSRSANSADFVKNWKAAGAISALPREGNKHLPQSLLPRPAIINTTFMSIFKTVWAT